MSVSSVRGVSIHDIPSFLLTVLLLLLLLLPPPLQFLAPEKLRGAGGILLNAEGKRFVNELGRRDYVTNHMLE